MTVHLDEQIDNNDDMIKAWTHMARADIFIMSQSSFSMVPAYLNTNCVIYPSNIDAPLENWVDGKDNKRSQYQASLQKCVARAVEGSQTERRPRRAVGRCGLLLGPSGRFSTLSPEKASYRDIHDAFGTARTDCHSMIDPPGTTPGRFSAVLWQSHGVFGIEIWSARWTLMVC